MRVKFAVVGTLVSGFALASVSGCQSSDVPIVKAPPAQAGESKPLPKEAKKGGGSSSSGNMNRNPGASS